MKRLKRLASNKLLSIAVIAQLIFSLSLGAWPVSAHHEDNWPGTEIDFTVPEHPIEGVGGDFHLDSLETEPIIGWSLEIFKEVYNPYSYLKVPERVYRYEKYDGTHPPAVFHWDGKADDGQYLLYGNSYSFEFQIEYVNISSFGQSGRLDIWSGYEEDYAFDSVTITPDVFVEGQGGKIDLSYLHVSSDFLATWILKIVDAQGQVVYIDDRSSGDSVTYLSELPREYIWDGFSNVAGEYFGQPVPAGKYSVVVDMSQGFENYPQVFSEIKSDIEIFPIVHSDPEEVLENEEDGTGDGSGVDEDLSPEELAERERVAKLHPVLFIHGLNAYPDMWRDAANNSDYVSLLQNWGYPEEYIATYSYSGRGVGKDGYNNQGSIVEVSKGMREAVLTLHEISLENGGDGEVDIVAHSMGGLVAREYIKEFFLEDYVSKVITVGTPFLGSDIANVYADISNSLNQDLKEMFVSAVGVWPNSEAIVDLKAKSHAISNLEYLDYASMYFALFGDIEIDLTFELFNLKIEREINIGDGVVSSESATHVSSGYKPFTFGFYDQKSVHLKLMSTTTLGYALRWLDLELYSSPYSHVNLVRNDNVKTRILKSL